MSNDNFKSVDKTVFEIAGLLDSTLRNAARGIELEELQVDYLKNWLNKEKDPLLGNVIAQLVGLREVELPEKVEEAPSDS
jgi:oligoribonuclease (3'-5' exoribonuclease)